MEPIELQVWLTSLAVELGISLPSYATAGAAGLDLLACIREPLQLLGSEHRLIPTGIHVAIPDGYEGQVRPRSGLALKSRITVLNTPGTVDSDYRGEVGVVLINHGSPHLIRPGDKIAQLVLAQVNRMPIVRVQSVSDLGETKRGQSGFGSTGR